MRRSLVVIAHLLIVAQLGFAAEGNVGLPRFPSISPDGSQIIFSFRGDLYKTPSAGGYAIRLTSHPFDDLVSAWSRDGKRIAFSSTRRGGMNLFVMNADGTSQRQVTETDRLLSLTGFGVDDQGREVLTLASYFEPESYRAPRPLYVSTDGGEIERVFDAFGSHPVVSPDGTKILFTRGTSAWTRRNYRGSDNQDIWMYDRTLGQFTRLTTWEGNDGRARWISNDAFVYASDREENTVHLYRRALNQPENQAVRLTPAAPSDVEEFDVAVPASTLVYANWGQLFTLNLGNANAKPTPLAIRADEDEQDEFALRPIDRTVSEAALSPDGKTMAYVTSGEIYVRAVDPKSPTRRVTATPARERGIAWAADGSKLYFVSDASGREGIYAATVRLTRSDVKKEIEALRKQSTTLIPEPTEGEVEAKEAAATQPATQPVTRPATQSSTQPASQPASQPVARGAAPTTQPAESTRWPDAIAFDVQSVIVDDENNTRPSPSPDGKSLAYSRGYRDLVIRNLADESTRTLFDGWSTDLQWRWSADSQHIAFVTEDENYNSDIWIVPADASAAPVNITRHPRNDHSPRWSADGKILSFLSERVNSEYDVWMVYLDKDLETLTAPELDQYYKAATAGARKREPVKPTTRPAVSRTISSPTGGGQGQSVDDNPAPTAPPATQAAQPTTQPSTRPVEEARPGRQLDLDDAYLRVRRVTTLSGSEANLEMSPAGDKFIFTATIGPERATYIQDREAPNPRRAAAAVSPQHLSLNGDQLVVVDSGRGGILKLAGAPEIEHLDISDRIWLDLRAQSAQKFLEAARIVGSFWYDPKLNNLNWDDLTKRYLELAREARTAHEFDHVANKFIGELNGSHLGINTPDPVSPVTRAIGRLAIKHKRVEGGIEVTEVYDEGPAGKGPMKLLVGDIITAIDLEPLTDRTTLDSKLANKVGKEVIVTVRRKVEGVRPSLTQRQGEADGIGGSPRPDGAEGARERPGARANPDRRELNLLLTPISYAAYADIAYHDWRLRTAKKVEEMSDGKFGYIHIQGMNQESLDIFERDLYAAAYGKQGLIIDVRNNGGGWTADRLLASIAAPQHAYTIARGMDASSQRGYPNDRLFITRYTLPINMLCNEKSFSNAEIISHAFKILKRGTLVGQRTAGGVISTGGTSLLDGTTVRIPFRGWYLPDGTNMELHGATPDLLVPQTPESEVKGDDAQLKAAVEDLLKRVN